MTTVSKNKRPATDNEVREMTAAEKRREAKRLSKLIYGVTVEYDPSLEVRGDPGSKGNQMYVSLDPDVFECGMAYFDCRHARDGKLTTELAACLALQGQRLIQAAEDLIQKFDLSRDAVLAAIEMEEELEATSKAARAAMQLEESSGSPTKPKRKRKAS